MPRMDEYVRVWAVMTATRHLTPPGRELLGTTAVSATCFAAFALPSEPVVLVAALVVRIAAILASLPYVHDAQHWCAQTDAVVLAALLFHLARRRRLTGKAAARWGRLTDAEADSVFAAARPTIQLQMILLYASAGACGGPSVTRPPPRGRRSRHTYRRRRRRRRRAG